MGMAADGESKNDINTPNSTPHGNHVESAIDTVLGNTEQSYEEFMGCFIGLKKEDVVSFHAHHLQESLKKQEVEGDPSQGQSSEADRSKFSPKLDRPEEDIDIEELDEGSYAPSRDAGDLSPGRKFVQMDNYVDDAELLEDDTHGGINEEEFVSSNYESSFGPDGQTMPPLRLSKDSLGIDGSHETEDGREAAFDGSEKMGNPRELKSSIEVIDSSAISSLRLADGLTESSQRVGDKEECEEPSETQPESQGGCEMKTLPGEADDDETPDGSPSLMTDSMVHRTELKMSSKGSDDSVQNDQETGASQETSSDEVQPFSLEMDFDYDNVTLTPKWDSNLGPTG